LARAFRSLAALPSARSVQLWFALLFALLLINALVSFRNIRRLAQDEERENEAQVTIQALEAVLARLSEIEDDPLRAEEGKRALGAVRQLLDEMKVAEGEQLRQRSAASRASARQAVLTVVLVSALALLLLALAHHLLRRERAERERAATASRRLASIIESSDDAIFSAALDGTVLTWNAAAERLYGPRADEARGQTVFFLLPPERRDELARLLERVGSGEHVAPFETTHVRRDGRPIDVLLAVSALRSPAETVTGASFIARDVSERKRLEAQLRQAQKMEAVGRLAGGIAHDFNNLLTAILGYSDLALLGLAPSSREHAHIGEVHKAAERAASLTRQLLTFSRKQAVALRPVDPHAVLADLGPMLHRVLGEDVELEFRLQPDAGLVLADPGQLEQLVLNLAVNARDAMPRGGTLTLETSAVTVAADDPTLLEGSSPGPYVQLLVRDTGVGMTDEVKAHLFEPFFTTKEEGKGTGLGLAMVFATVKQGRGHLQVVSEPGRGATFLIRLPRVERLPESPPPVAAVRAVAPSRGSETILLVEDEERVRALLRAVLQQQGYTLLEAGRGNEALALGEQQSGPIHLLVTDVVMPGMSGHEVAGRLADRHPELKVLYLSGHADDVIGRHGVEQAEAAFLQKPFSPEALLRKVREVLDA
jgi:PAS domain S-box-containing protein